MIEALVEYLIKTIQGGGTTAEILCIVFLAMVAYLWHENRSLKSQIAAKEEKIDKIMNDYQQGNLTLTEALNSLKLVLYEIKGKIG